MSATSMEPKTGCVNEISKLWDLHAVVLMMNQGITLMKEGAVDESISVLKTSILAMKYFVADHESHHEIIDAFRHVQKTVFSSKMLAKSSIFNLYRLDFSLCFANHSKISYVQKRTKTTVVPIHLTPHEIESSSNDSLVSAVVFYNLSLCYKIKSFEAESEELRIRMLKLHEKLLVTSFALLGELCCFGLRDESVERIFPVELSHIVVRSLVYASDALQDHAASRFYQGKLTEIEDFSNQFYEETWKNFFEQKMAPAA